MDDNYVGTIEEEKEWQRINKQEEDRRVALEKDIFFKSPTDDSDLESFSIEDIVKILKDENKVIDIKKLREISDILKKREMQHKTSDKTLVKRKYPPTMAGYIDALILSSIVGFLFGVSMWIFLMMVK